MGGVRSPILANIYLHELDCYVESLFSDFNKGKERRDNPEYNANRLRANRLNKKIKVAKGDNRQGLLDQKLVLQRRMLEIPSTDQHDPGYRRLRYCRYADDFVLGATCSKSEAEEIYGKIQTFLSDNLKLKVSQEKSGLKHNTESIRFLGYDITIKNTEKIVKMKTYGQQCKRRTCKAIVWLTIPEAKLKSFAERCLYGNWETLEAKQKAFLLNASDAEIALQYTAEMRGIAQYYALAKNFASLGKLRILGIRSFLKTMANTQNVGATSCYHAQPWKLPRGSRKE